MVKENVLLVRTRQAVASTSAGKHCLYMGFKNNNKNTLLVWIGRVGHCCVQPLPGTPACIIERMRARAVHTEFRGIFRCSPGRSPFRWHPPERSGWWRCIRYTLPVHTPLRRLYAGDRTVLCFNSRPNTKNPWYHRKQERQHHYFLYFPSAQFSQ